MTLESEVFTGVSAGARVDARRTSQEPRLTDHARQRGYTRDMPHITAGAMVAIIVMTAHLVLAQSKMTPTGIAVNATYVNYLRRVLPAGAVRLRTTSPSQPVIIIAAGKAVGVLMPVKQ